MGEEGGLARVDGGRGRVRDHRYRGKGYCSAKFEYSHGLFAFVLLLGIA